MLKAGDKGAFVAPIGVLDQGLESFWPPVENES